MKKAAVVTLALFIGVVGAALFLPANLAQFAVKQMPGIDAIRFGGTIWHGQTTLIVESGQTAKLSWRLARLTNPQSNEIFGLQPSFQWTLGNADLDLKGTLDLHRSTASLLAEGKIDSNALTPILNRFDIFLSGHFLLAPTQVTAPYDARSLEKVSLINPTTLAWSGGQISYILTGQYNQIELPRLVAHVDKQSNQTVIANINDGSNNAKLLDLALNQDGIIRVRLNRRFIDLLAFPWPGEQDPNDVIIEVERTIL